MCGPRYAASPTPMQNVFFRWPPQASTGRAKGRRTGMRPRHVAAGAPKTTGLPAMTRATESSQRDSISRSCTRKRSAMPPSRSRASPFAVRDRLVREVAGGHDEGPSRVVEQEVVERRVGQQEADQRIAGRDLGRERSVPSRRGTSTMGRSVDASSSRSRSPRKAISPAASRSRTMTAKRLLVASLATAQTRDGRRRGGVAGEVESADALDGNDAAGCGEPPPPPGSGRPSREAGRRRPRPSDAGRRRGRRWAGRGTGGRAGHRTRAGSRRTCETAPSSSQDGRTARRGRS